MRAFVTGARGFVGSRLLPRLEAEGYQLAETPESLDVSDRDSVTRAMAAASPDVVIHLAAMSSVAQSWRQPERCFRDNYLGTLEVVRAMQALCPDARLLFVGSGDTYGSRSPGAPPCKESDELFPRSPYARTKAAAERSVCAAGEQGLDVVCTRSFNHTGAGHSEDFVASSFARQLGQMEAGEIAPRLSVGNLDSVRDFLDVEDVIDAYLALLRPETPSGVYNVASGEPIRIQEILTRLTALSSVDPEVHVDPERFRESDHLVGDPTLLKEVTGWQPRIPLDATLAELLDHWRH